MKNEAALKNLYLLSLIFFAFACGNAGGNKDAGTNNQTSEVIQGDPTSLENIDWLVGTWMVNNGEMIEKWQRNKDGSYSGVSFNLKGDKTKIQETIKIKMTDEGVLQYIPSVRTQNGGRPIPFDLTNNNSKNLIFENPEHDFPKLIRYQYLDSASIRAEVASNEKELIFNLKRKDK